MAHHPGMRPMPDPAYVELAAASNFSFLRGASHAEELVVQAARLGLGGIAITDRNSLAGVVRGHMAAKEAGLAFAPGCRLVFIDGTPDILVWPEDRAAYGNLCELLTLGKRRAPKGECHLTLEDCFAHGRGLLMALGSAFSRE
jgi:DNA polymerase III alpha subunit